MQKYKQDDYESSKVHTITVYNEAGDIVKTYSGPYMNIENKNNIIYFTCNNTNMSFAVESSSNKDSENYTVVVDDNTAKSLGLKANSASNPVSKDTDNTVSDNSSSDGSQSSQECSNAATVAVKFAKGKIESDSVVSPTLISDTQAYLAKLNYDKSIIVQEIAVKGGKVKVVVSKDDCTDNNSETKTSSVNYSGSDVDLK